MSNKEKRKPVSKYLRANEFVVYCKANNVDASPHALEAYEKAGLLFPIYRLVKPDEYVRAEFKCHIDPNPKASFNVDTKCQEIIQLKDALSLYHNYPPGLHFKQALKEGHPLDCAYKNKNPFLYKPSMTDFKPWEEYSIFAGTISGHPIKQETVEHYYAFWQIFVVDELNLWHTIEENYVAKQRKGWGVFNRDIYPSKLLEYSELFQTVSNFEMKEKLTLREIDFGLNQSVIEGELLEEFNKRREAAATEEYKIHPHSEGIKFIRKLSELYTNYQEREKIKLSNELKGFLTSTINMLMDATNMSFEKICDEYDGRFTGHRGLCKDDKILFYPGELELIFPSEIKQIKERSQQIIDIHLKELNKLLPEDSQIDPHIKDNLIENIIQSDHWVLLSHLHQINELWIHHGSHWESSIWAHITRLANAIESMGKEWFKGKDLPTAFRNAFGQEYMDLGRTFKSLGTDFVKAKTPAEYKTKLNKILKHSEKFKKGICGHHLFVTLLTRNYLSHNVKFESDMLGSLFLEICKNLVFTLISLFVKKPSEITLNA